MQRRRRRRQRATLFRNHNGKASSIVYNDALPVRGRINFVLAHELGHYLRHRRALDEFLCSQRDMIEWDREDQVREADANQFASGACFRTRNVVYPVPEMSVASGRYGDARRFAGWLGRRGRDLPPRVWFPREPVLETSIFSDRFDMAISVLQLERDGPYAVDSDPEEEDVFYRIQGA